MIRQLMEREKSNNLKGEKAAQSNLKSKKYKLKLEDITSYPHV